MNPRPESGFTLVEVLVAVAIAMIVFMALATMQGNLTRENRAITQKLEASDFARLMSQMMADENLCQCNVAGVTLSPGPADPASGLPTLQADLPKIFSACGTQVLIAPGTALPVGSNSLPVDKIRLNNLIAPNPAVPNLYTGFIEVTLRDQDGAKDPKLVRQVAPIRVPKKFFVTKNQITSCGASEQEYVIKTGVWTTSDLLATAPIRTACPDGMIAISGGWRNENGAIPSNCPAHYAAVMTNAPDPDGNAWLTLVLCHSYTPFVTCYKPTFPVGP